MGTIPLPPAKKINGRHPNTVARVMDVLDRLGEEQVEVSKHRGTKRVIFDGAIVENLGTIEIIAPQNTGVVIGAVG